jgi:hypothetical protein
VTIHLTALTYSVVAFVVGLVLMATGETVGDFIPMPSGRQILGFLLWLSIPFVWLGTWLR